MVLEAVVFDFFGTLTPGRRPDAQTAARHEQAVTLGVDPADYDAMLTETYRDRFRGATGGVEESLSWVAMRLGVIPSPATLAHAAAVRLRTERVFAEPREEVLPLVNQLRADGLRVGLISDCTAELPLVFGDLAIAPLIDAAVFSCVTGQVKPDPPNYLTCCERLHVDPARACMSVTVAAMNWPARPGWVCIRCIWTYRPSAAPSPTDVTARGPATRSRA